MSTNAHPSAPQQKNGIVIDSDTLAAKSTIMKRWKVNAMLNSVSKVSAFVAGPLFAWGVIEAIKYGAKTLAAGAATAATSGAGAAAGTAAAVGAAAVSLPTVMTILAVGAAFALVAVASDYIATRKGQSTYFDNQEAISQSTGRHIAQELKKEGLCITTTAPAAQTEHPSNMRSDGKSWTQAVSEQQAQQAAR